MKWIGRDELLVARTYRLVPQNRSSIFVTLRLKVSKKSLFRKELTCVLFVILWPLFGVFDELACFHSINNTLAFNFSFSIKCIRNAYKKSWFRRNREKQIIYAFQTIFNTSHWNCERKQFPFKMNWTKKYLTPICARTPTVIFLQTFLSIILFYVYE